MEAGVVIPVGFQQARARLRGFQRKSFTTVVSGLSGFRYSVECVQILKELNPNRLLGMILDGATLLDDDVRDDLIRGSLEEINTVAPLDETMAWADLEAGELPLLYPDSLNMQVSWDTWAEMTNQPDGYFDVDRSGPWALCSALRLGDEMAFESFSEYFGWDLRYPPRSGANLDWKKMFKLLDKNGLSCFKTVWDIASYDTGNIYYDINYYDELDWELPPFSLEGVLRIKQEYQAAQLLEAEYRRATLLANQPGSTVLKTVLSIYKRSLIRDKDKPARSNKLIDILGERQWQEDDYTDPLGVLEGHRETRTLRGVLVHNLQNQLEELARTVGDFNPFEYAENGPDQDEENDGFGNNL